MAAPRYDGGEGTWLLLGMVEEIQGRYPGGCSQRKEHLGESRVDMTRLNCAMWGYREGKRKEREGSQVGAAFRRPKGTKRVDNQNGWIT